MGSLSWYSYDSSKCNDRIRNMLRTISQARYLAFLIKFTIEICERTCLEPLTISTQTTSHLMFISFLSSIRSWLTLRLMECFHRGTPKRGPVRICFGAISQGVDFVLKSVKAHKSSETVETDDQEHTSASPTNFERRKELDHHIKASKGPLLCDG